MLESLKHFQSECPIDHVIKCFLESLLDIILSETLHVARLRQLMMLVYHVLNLLSASVKQRILLHSIDYIRIMRKLTFG